VVWQGDSLKLLSQAKKRSKVQFARALVRTMRGYW